MHWAFAGFGLTNTVKKILIKISKESLKINFSAEGNFTTIKESTVLKNIRSKIEYLNGKMEFNSKQGSETLFYLPINHN
ncbi:MAG TPA: hypothetical protein PLP23_12905 [Panacibacter sp.]|nr:hypothetical protein [Panacibacter sp.]